MTSGVKRPDTEMMAERILMIDDDSRLAGMVSDYLGGAGFRLTIAGTAREGEALLKRETFDAIILDLMLPDADGLDLCRRLRAVTDLPILMLTARGEPMDRVVGLEVGADDYLAKPFEPRELRPGCAPSCAARASPARREMLRFGRLEIDKGARVRAHRRRGAADHLLPVRDPDRAGRARRPRAVARCADGSAEGREARGLRPLGRRPYLAHPRRHRGRTQEARAASSRSAAPGTCSRRSRTNEPLFTLPRRGAGRGRPLT